MYTCRLTDTNLFHRQYDLFDKLRVSNILSLNTFTVDNLFRVARVLIGAFILLLISWSILIPQLLPASGKSVVNAKLEWSRTSIEGKLNFENFKVGDHVKKGDLIAEVINERAVDTLLDSLLHEKSVLKTTLYTLNNRHQQLLTRKATLQRSLKQTLQDLHSNTKTKVHTIETEILVATNTKLQHLSKIQRYRKANQSYSASQPYSIVSRAVIDDEKAKVSDIEAVIIKQKAELKALNTVYSAAISGISVSNKTLPEREQIAQIDQTLAIIESERTALKMRNETTSRGIVERSAQLSLKTKHKFTARVNGILWDVGYTNGSYVHAGDSLIAIADNDSITVECIFHQRYLDNITIGDHAIVDLMGSNQRLAGKVSKIMIRDQVKSNDLNAFSFLSPDTNEFKVVVTLLNLNENETPRIGQRAKVIINKNESNLAADLFFLFSR